MNRELISILYIFFLIALNRCLLVRGGWPLKEPVNYQCNSYGFNTIVESDKLLPDESCAINMWPI